VEERENWRRRLFIHLPYPHLLKHWDEVEREDFNLEICFFPEDLELLKEERARRRLITLLSSRRFTVHAPYEGIFPASNDPGERKRAFEIFRLLLERIADLRPEVIVFHPYYRRGGEGLALDEWLKRSEEFWGRMATEVAECGARIALENIYEEEPEPLRLLLDRLPEEEVGLCFDTGHFNAFSRASLSQWINAFGKRIFELHLHDNHGASDEHLGMGRGTFPFDELFLLLKENASSPFLTIEGKDEEAIRQSLEFLSRKRQILP